MQLIVSLALAPMATSIFWTATDPFVGKWTLNVPRSTIVDQMRVEAAGPNTYRFEFEGAAAETIVADGTDQPGLQGTTLSVKPGNERSLTVIRKQNGHIIISAAWKLSADGSTLRDSFTSFQPGGSSMTVHYVYRRMTGTSGFAGAWESTTKPIGLKLEMAIEPYDKSGFSFVSGGSEKKVIFDGRNHPGTTEGMSFSGRRIGMRALEYTEKLRGKVERVRQFQLSKDGRTLTETVRIAGQKTPDVLVFDHE